MASQLNDLKKQLRESLQDTSKPWTSVLTSLEEKTGVDRLYICLGGIGFLGLWLAFGCAAQLVCNTVSFLYPAYASIHAIESPAKDDDTKWLTYWVVFAVFSIVEFFADAIVGWFPLYWLAKFTVFIWLMIPTSFNGSIIIYNRIIRPYFLKNHGAIDDGINRIRAQASKLLEKEK